MVVWNSKRMLGIVIRHDGENVRLVPLKPGRLGVGRYTRQKFESEWSPCDQPLPSTLDAALDQAGRQGATAEALKGLETLARRDRCVVASLF